jgi:hypothetical protein
VRAKLLAAILSLFCISSADAAFTRVQGGSVVVTLPSAVTTGDLIVVSVAWASTVTDTVTVKDDKNDTFTLVDNFRAISPNNFYLQSAYFLNVTAGAQTFTATISTARQFADIFVDEFSGVATTAALDGNVMNTAQSNNPPAASANSVTSTTITPTTNGDLIYGATLNLTGVGTQSVGTGFTQAQLTANLFLSEFLTQATAASIAATMTPTSGSDNWITYVMAFKPTAGAAPVAHLRLLKDVGQ